MNHSYLSTTFSKNKKQKKKNNGDNIIQKINIKKTVTEFVNFYYSNLNTNPNQLVSSNVLREYSSIKYDGIKYSGKEYFELVCNFFKNNIKMKPTKVDFIDSGSRRIDISLLGTATNNNKQFTQTFLLSHNNKGWFVKNSILIIV
tara:strand:- start:282 stop:716 length:435 start_codon:yes stop_codon:yes gene_type:complete